jgi:hypothetical protein
MYPKSPRRNRFNLDVQGSMDKLGQHLITERETFMEQDGLSDGADPAVLSLLFDELYCRRLLGLVPDID